MQLKLGLYQINDLSATKPRLGKQADAPVSQGDSMVTNVTGPVTDTNAAAPKPEMEGILKANLYEIADWLKKNPCPVHKDRLVRDCVACVGRWNQMCKDLNK